MLLWTQIIIQYWIEYIEDKQPDEWNNMPNISFMLKVMLNFDNKGDRIWVHNMSVFAFNQLKTSTDSNTFE